MPDGFCTYIKRVQLWRSQVRLHTATYPRVHTIRMWARLHKCMLFDLEVLSHEPCYTQRTVCGLKYDKDCMDM